MRFSKVKMMDNPNLQIFYIVIIFIVSIFFYAFISFERKRGIKGLLFKELMTPYGIGTFVALLAVITSLTITITKPELNIFKKEPKRYIPVSANNVKFQSLEKTINDLERRIEKYEKMVTLYSDSTMMVQDRIDDKALEVIREELNKAKSSISNFEQLLITDAEKIITLPLLRREVESIRGDVIMLKDNIQSTNNLIQEIQTQNRWVLGTLGLGILALLVSVVKSTRIAKGE